jgi:3',5'-cyclic-AMP phosphodiesterase
MIVFAQITDLHIDTDDPDLKHVDSRANALAVLDDIQKQNIEQIILTGDLSESTSGISWLLNEIDKRKFRYEIVLGNHDDVQLYTEEKILSNTRTYYSRRSDGFLFLFLDSSENLIDPEQLVWIDEQLSHASEDVIVFVHHPVLDCGGSIMDKRFPLKNREEASKVFMKSDKRISLFCGHYHREEIVRYGNIVQFLTPSALYQIKKYSPKIEIEGEATGYRVLSVDKGKYETQVKYVKVINSVS